MPLYNSMLILRRGMPLRNCCLSLKAHHLQQQSKVAWKGSISSPLSTQAQPLSQIQRQNSLKRLSYANTISWKANSDETNISKTFEFTDFNQAWGFMSRCALLAEKIDHHPEWFNVYNRVEVTLTTHDCGGLSNKDIEFAEAMDQYASDLLPFLGSSSDASTMDGIEVTNTKS